MGVPAASCLVLWIWFMCCCLVYIWMSDCVFKPAAGCVHSPHTDWLTDWLHWTSSAADQHVKHFHEWEPGPRKEEKKTRATVQRREAESSKFFFLFFVGLLSRLLFFPPSKGSSVFLRPLSPVQINQMRVDSHRNKMSKMIIFLLMIGTGSV